jgi:hypothetical protein
MKDEGRGNGEWGMGKKEEGTGERGENLQI